MMEVICPWLVKLPYLNLVHIMLPSLVHHLVPGKAAFLVLRLFLVHNVCNLICLYFQEHFWWTLLQGFGRWHKKSDSKSSGFASLKKICIFLYFLLLQRDTKRRGKGLFQNTKDADAGTSTQSGSSPLTSPQHKVGVVITSSRQAHRRFAYY